MGSDNYLHNKWCSSWRVLSKRNENDLFFALLVWQHRKWTRDMFVWCVLICVLHLKAIHCALLLLRLDTINEYNRIVSYRISWNCLFYVFKLSVEWTSNLNIPITIVQNECTIRNRCSALFNRVRRLIHREAVSVQYVARFTVYGMTNAFFRLLFSALDEWSNDFEILKMNLSAFLVKKTQKNCKFIAYFSMVLHWTTINRTTHHMCHRTSSSVF